MQNIGVVDAEYVIHYGLPTLGEPAAKKVRNGLPVSTFKERLSQYN